MAQTRTIRTVLEMNVGRFQAGATAAAASAKSLARELDDLSRRGGDVGKAYDRVGTTMLTAGGTMAAGLGLAAKAAMEWESAWAGVQKTTDGSPEQMAHLEGELRNLARTLPATHTEIAAVAEAAGQLGIKRDDIAEFTKTMINLGETTNLSADEAATSLARFTNIMGTSVDQVDNLGATLVGLGNNFATTEQEIMAMSMRLAGTGHQMGMTEGDVMGLAAAMSSVGIEAEAGGTAMSTVMKKIDAAVRDGGESLQTFADVAGVSADEFAAKWRSSPSEALVLFTQGLAKAGEEGQSLSAILGDLGIKGIREQDTMLRLAGAHQVLADAIATGNDEFVKNTALLIEANKRYATTESQMKVAFNNIKDASIEIGAALLPVLASGAEGVASLAQAFGALPAPAQQTIATFGSFAAAGLLVGGGLMKLIPAANDTIQAFKTIKSVSPGAASALGKFGGVAVKVSAAVGALGLVQALSAAGSAMSDFSIGVEELSVNTAKLGDTANPMKLMLEGMEGFSRVDPKPGKEMSEYIANLADPGIMGGLADTASNIEKFWNKDASTWADEAARVKEYGDSLANLADTDLGAAIDTFSSMTESMQLTDEAAAQLLELMPGFRDKLVGVAEANGLATDNATLLAIALGEQQVSTEAAADGAGELSDQMSETESALQAAAEAADEFNKQMQATASGFLDSRESARKYAETLGEVKKNAGGKGHWEDGTAAAKKNAEAIDDLSRAAMDNIEAMSKNGEKTSATMKKSRDDIIKTAMSMGASREEAEAYVNQLGLTPETIETQAEFDGAEAEAAYKDWVAKNLSGENPPTVKIDADTEPATAKYELLDGKLKTMDQSQIHTTIEVDADEAQAEADAAKAALQSMPEYSSVTIGGDASKLHSEVKGADLALAYIAAQSPNPKLSMSKESFDVAVRAADARLKEIARQRPTPKLNAEKSALERVTRAAQQDINLVKGKTVQVKADAQGKGELQELRNEIARIVGKTVVVRVRGVMSGIDRLKQAAGLNTGGWVNRGLSDGGWVPGGYPGPGVDNVLWPLAPGAYGGRFLAQPLAGDEYVVKGSVARQWGGRMDLINSGRITPADVGGSASLPSHITLVDADGTFLGRMRTVATDSAINVVNAR